MSAHAEDIAEARIHLRDMLRWQFVLMFPFRVRVPAAPGGNSDAVDLACGSITKEWLLGLCTQHYANLRARTDTSAILQHLDCAVDSACRGPFADLEEMRTRTAACSADTHMRRSCVVRERKFLADDNIFFRRHPDGPAYPIAHPLDIIAKLNGLCRQVLADGVPVPVPHPL